MSDAIFVSFIFTIPFLLGVIQSRVECCLTWPTADHCPHGIGPALQGESARLASFQRAQKYERKELIICED